MANEQATPSPVAKIALAAVLAAVTAREHRLHGPVAQDKACSDSSQEILHLELKGDNVDTNDAFSVIDGVEKVNTVSGNGGGSTAYDISISGSRDIREEIFNKSVENGWTILEMHLHKNNLEDVFRNLTKSQGG